ncbi:hypothetical protein NDI47_05270 [Microcoleus vaginatus GB1-A2]|uniref:hypothetical protein n=1 Tax=Microcoleus vaginatus TaxID=119532 RepID=UPI0016892358|nr:hypothetical protein [Microcoleus sp. FACHB-61]
MKVLAIASFSILQNRQDACSTKSKFFCGVGILPARQRLIEMGTVDHHLGEAIAVELLEVRSKLHQYVLKFIVNAHICYKGLQGDRTFTRLI